MIFRLRQAVLLAAGLFAFTLGSAVQAGEFFPKQTHTQKYSTLANQKHQYDKDNEIVAYDEKERERRRLAFRDGVIYVAHTGQILGVDFVPANDRFDYVMDEDGNFYGNIYDPPEDRSRRHSSFFLALEEAQNRNYVASAGELDLDCQCASPCTIESVNTHSGHYRPYDPMYLERVLNELASFGFRISELLENTSSELPH